MKFGSNNNKSHFLRYNFSSSYLFSFVISELYSILIYSKNSFSSAKAVDFFLRKKTFDHLTNVVDLKYR